MENTGLQKRFEEAIREHELLIYKICRVYAPAGAGSKDFFQEIVIQLWKAYPKFNGQSKFSTWLYRVAINTAITGLRKRKDFITSYEPASLDMSKGDEKYDEAGEERLQQLHITIDQLGQVEKAIVMLYMEDRPYDEMEEIPGISTGNLRIKMNRIREKLANSQKLWTMELNDLKQAWKQTPIYKPVNTNVI